MAGLWVSHLRLSHFRSHGQLTLHLDQRPVAIFGPNGSGKTNILEALSFLSPGRGLRRAASFDVARRPESVGWKVSAELYNADISHQIQTGAEQSAHRFVQLNDKTVPQNTLGGVCRIVWLVPNMDRLWVEGADGRRRFLDRLCLSFFAAHADHTLAYEKAMRERNRLLKNQVVEPSWYGALERQMAEAGAALNANRLQTIKRLSDAIRSGGSAFPECALTLLNPDGTDCGFYTADQLSADLNHHRRKDMAAGRSLIGPHRADLMGKYTAKNMRAVDCSTGEQKALLLSIVLAHARALKADCATAPLLLLDEVAAHLDADRCAALYTELKMLGAQAWMTGTGPEVFDALEQDVQRIFVVEKDGKSVVTTL